MKRNVFAVSLLAAFGAAALAGCSSQEKQSISETNNPPLGEPPPPAAAKPEPAPEPVTLMMMDQNGLNEFDFELMFVRPIEKKYPHIKVVKTSTNNITQLLASGEVPDLITTHNGNFGVFDDLQLLYDHTQLAKCMKLDLTRFDPTVLKALAITSPTVLNGIPYSLNFSALYYNKDLFDTFGVPYPPDGMTWDEAIELGKKMTRKLGDVQIRGLDPYALTRFQRILGNTFYDPVTNKSTLNTPEWKRIFEFTKSIITIPGNEWTDAEVKNAVSGEANFYQKRISAMYGGNNMVPRLEKPTQEGLNWDVAQYPSMPERPNVFNDIDAHLTFITSASKHKEEAMKVLAELISEETQMELVRKTGRKSPLSDPKYDAAFAQDMPFARDKNHAGVFKSHFTNSPVRPKYFSQANTYIKEAFYSYYHGQDVNSALREADEKMNKFLEAEANK
jgi:multiple sugar transport system substrate-binding protein